MSHKINPCNLSRNNEKEVGMEKKLPTSCRDLGTETVSRLSKKRRGRFFAKLLENESP